jgi:hypothetical protein
MPNQDSNLTALRAGGWQQWYLAAFVGTAVLTGAVTADAADGATSLAYTTSTGSSANVKRGYLIRVTTAAGLFKGLWRVRASGALSSIAMPITELSAGSVDINSGDLIEVRNVILPGSKVVEATSDFKPDGLAAGTNNSAIPPMAACGPHRIAPLDSGQAYATVTFANLSYAVDADSAGTLTYAWVAATATGTTTSTSAAASFTFPVGEHLAVLTVTDSSNSATWTTYRKVLVYDPANPTAVLMDVILEGIESDIEPGTSARFRLPDGASLDDLPDGTMVALVCIEYINGVQQSFGNAVSAASNVKCLGYLRRESNSNSAEDGTQELSFEIVSPIQFYKELVTGYSKVFQNNAAADAWNELDDLSVKRAIIEVPRFYTWLTEWHDFIFHSTFDDRDYSTLFLQKSNPVDQFREFARAVDARVTCDRTGRFEVQMQPYAIAEGSRSGITTWGTYTDADRGDYSFDRDHWPVVEMVEGRGLTDGTSTSNNQPVFARYPGAAPGLGLNNLIIDGLIADDQTDINTRLGRLAEWEIGNYFTSTGVKHVALEGETTFPGSYLVFDPAYCEYLKLDFDDATNLRGIDLNDHRFIITRVSFVPNERGSGEVTVGWRTATNAVASGVTYVPPQEADNGLPPWTPPNLSFPPIAFTPPDFTLLPKGTGTMGVLDAAKNWHVTPDWTTPPQSGGPTWTTAALSLSGTPLHVVPIDTRLGGTYWAMILTTSHIYGLSGAFGNPTVTQEHALGAAMGNLSGTLDFAIGALKGMCVYIRSSGEVMTTYTTDGGLNWSAEAQIGSTAIAPGGSTHQPGVALIGSDLAYASAWTGAGPTSGWWRQLTSGGAWANFSVAQGDFPNEIHVPFAAPSTRLYTDSSVTIFHTYKNGVDVSPTVGLTTFGPRRARGGIATCHVDPSTVLMVGWDDVGSSADLALFASRSGGGSASAWQRLTVPAETTAGAYSRVFCSGDNNDIAYLTGFGKIAYIPSLTAAIAAAAGGSYDDPGTIHTKTGNLSLGTTEALGLIGLPAGVSV